MNTLQYASGVVITIFLMMGMATAAGTEGGGPVQGTAIIDEVIEVLSMIETDIQETGKDAAVDHANLLDLQFNRYIDHEGMFFAGEIDTPDGLTGMIERIPDMITGLRTALAGEAYEDAGIRLQELSRELVRLRTAIDVPVLLDFTGSTCKGCKVMKARLKTILPDYLGKVRITCVDVNGQKDLTRQYRIMLIPTLVFIDQAGIEVARHTGVMEEVAVRAKLTELLGE